MVSEAKKAAKARYDAKTAVYISLKLNTNTDKELIELLKRQQNVQGFLKELIRKDMKKWTNTMMYKIKPEFLDMWGADSTNENTILTESDLERITRGWDKTPADVMDQLIPYSWESIVNLMDDEIREAVHADLAPCSEIEFLEEYKKRHMEKYGEEFQVN